jgi:hypothetical protein
MTREKGLSRQSIATSSRTGVRPQLELGPIITEFCPDSQVINQQTKAHLSRLDGEIPVLRTVGDIRARHDHLGDGFTLCD